MREYLYVFTLGLRNSIIYKIDFFSKLFLSFIPIFLYGKVYMKVTILLA